MGVNSLAGCVLRPPTPALLAPAAQVVKADFDDPDSLLEAFRGCDAVFAVTGGT